MKIYLSSIRQGIENCKDSRVEFISALSVIIYGMWLMNPYIHTYIYSSELMQSLISESMWGALMLALGLISLYGLWQCNSHIRRAAIMAIVVMRMFMIAAIGYQSNLQSTAMPDNIAWVLISGWAYLRLKS